MDRKTIIKIRICIVVVVLTVAFVANTCWHTEYNELNDFLIKQDLKVSFRVLDIKQTGEHGYGVIYGEIISSNKPNCYIASYNDQFTVCKIENGKILYVSYCNSFMKSDTITIQSKIEKVLIQRKNESIREYELDTTTDWVLYMYLKDNNLLDFNTYKSYK